MIDCHEEPWEYTEQLYLLEVLVDEVTMNQEAAYGGDSAMLSLSAKVKFLDYPEMEVEPNELVVAHRQKKKEDKSQPECEIPGFPSQWEVSLASDLPDFQRFPQYRVKIPVKKAKPLKSYIITVLVPQIAVTAGEALRYTYTALEKNTEPEVMESIKAQLLEKIEQDNKKVEEEPLSPIKFASGKSCIFRMSPVDLINKLKKFPLYVMLYSNGIVDAVPVNLLVGKVRIVFGDPFFRAVLLVENSSVLPVSTHVEEMFQMEDIFGKPSGTVGLFVRLSCFGSSLSPPMGQDIIEQPKPEVRECEEQPVGESSSRRRRPEALLADDDDLTLGMEKAPFQERMGMPITWRRAGDKMPEIPKPKVSALPAIHLPLPPPPPREEPPFDLADHLPGLPRCTPSTQPPCYRRPGDPPLSRCGKEMEKQLQREEQTKAVQTESYEPIKRLPPQSPYIDRTVNVPETFVQSPPSMNPGQVFQSDKPISQPQQFGNQPVAGTEEACECSKSVDSPQPNIQKQENNQIKNNPEGKSKLDESTISVDQSPDKSKQNIKATSSDESSCKKKLDISTVSEAGMTKEGTEKEKEKDVESNVKPQKRCTCQDLTPEQKKMKQKPPPCTCKRRGKGYKKEKKLNEDGYKKRGKKKECPECQRIKLNGNLMRALQKITALEAQHDLTDSKVDAILKEEYGNRGGDLVDNTDAIKKKGPLEMERNLKIKEEIPEVTAEERETELRGKFKDIIEAEVTKFEERKKQTLGVSRGEGDAEKHAPPKDTTPAKKEKKHRKKKTTKQRTDSELQEILKWMYPGQYYGHKLCLRPLRLVPKTMGWLWNVSNYSGLVKPGLGWRPGAIRSEVHQSIREWKKSRGGEFVEEDDETLAWGARQKRRPATPKSPGSKKAESIKYNPTLHMHKKNGFYYISMYPIRSNSMDELGVDPKPAMFKINAKRPEGSDASEISTDSSSDQESYDIEFITPSAMQKQIKKAPKSNASAQYLEEDFMPKIKKKKVEPEPEKPKETKQKEAKKGKGKGKGKKK